MNEPHTEHDATDAGTANQPEPGTDSTVEDWFGQSVQRDAELAEELVEEVGPEEAERRFDQEAHGAEEQDHRHGQSIDPDQGTSAYRDDGEPSK